MGGSPVRRSGGFCLARKGGEIIEKARLWRGGERLTPRQQAKLEWIEKTNQPRYRRLSAQGALRLVFQLPLDAALDFLEAWLG